MTNYPPIVNSSIPAFSYDKGIQFYFEYPHTIGTKNIPNYYLDIKISDAQTNKIVHRNMNASAQRDNNGKFYVTIPQFAKMGLIYKI
jgi:hypothetical protein